MIEITFKTPFDIGDKVFVKDENSIKEVVVYQIRYTYYRNANSAKLGHLAYYCSNGKRYFDEELFETRGDCKKYYNI